MTSRLCRSDYPSTTLSHGAKKAVLESRRWPKLRITAVSTWFSYKKYTIRIFHECEVQIEQSVRGSLFGITRLYRVMPNSDPEGRIFLSTPNNYDRFLFLCTFRSPAFDFNIVVAMNESCCFTLTSAILKVDVVCVVIRFYPSHGSDMGMYSKIRFVSTGENRGKPCLVYKNICSSRKIYCNLEKDNQRTRKMKTHKHIIPNGPYNRLLSSKYVFLLTSHQFKSAVKANRPKQTGMAAMSFYKRRPYCAINCFYL